MRAEFATTLIIVTMSISAQGDNDGPPSNPFGPPDFNPNGLPSIGSPGGSPGGPSNKPPPNESPNGWRNPWQWMDFNWWTALSASDREQNGQPVPELRFKDISRLGASCRRVAAIMAGAFIL